MTEPVYPADVVESIDPASLTYDVQPPWFVQGTGRCRSCGATIAWAQHEHTLRRAPFNPDGTSHLDTCPDRDAWRRPRQGRHL